METAYLETFTPRHDEAVLLRAGLAAIEARYVAFRDKPGDLNEHMPLLRCYAERVDRVTEFGVGHSSWAFLQARPRRLRFYDIGDDPRRVGMSEIVSLGNLVGTDTDFLLGSTLEVEIEETDLLFIDTKHTFEQLSAELSRHAGKVSRYIVMHDTELYGRRGEDGSEPGLLGAIADLLARGAGWRMRDQLRNSYGLTILERR